MLANFSNLITFSRGTNATLVDASGRLTYAPHNLVTNSQDFEAAAWVKFNSSAAANVTAAPDGSFTADAITENTATNQHGIYQGATVAAGTTYVWSGYVKSNGRSIVQFQLQATANVYFVEFDLTTLTTTNRSGSGTATITNAGNGWYRISAAATATGSGTGYWQLNLCSAANTTSYTGNGASGVYLWGAQLEAVTYQTTPSPYVSTSVANLLGFSEAFDNAAWTKSNASIVTGAAQNPINQLWNAQKLMENTANSTHTISQTISYASGSSYTLSFYAKAAERSFLAIQPFSNSIFAYFNLANGTVATTGGSPISTSIISVGNGWYRCSITAVSPGTSTLVAYVAGADNTPNYVGDGNSGIYIYGAQLSNSGSLDAYVPTPGAAPSSTAYYGPRFDYDPVTLAAKGILIEEARTNLFTRSEEFDNAIWPKANATITANVIVAPDGTTTADKIVPNNGVSGYVYRNTGISSGSAAFSIYVKAAEWGFVRILFGGSFSPSNSTYIRLSDGVVTSGSGFTAQSVGNGWFRITGSSTYSTATDNTIYIIPTNSGSSDTNGNGTSGIYVWGGQMENASFATSYIPTVASSVTRSADVASITGSLFNGWYRQDEGTLVATVQKLSTSASAPYAWELTGASSNFSMRIRLGTDSRMQSVDGGAVQVDSQIGSPVLTTAAKYAMAYRLNDYAGSTGGASAVADTTGTVPAVATLNIGSAAVTNLYIRNITYIPNRISDAQLQAATS